MSNSVIYVVEKSVLLINPLRHEEERERVRQDSGREHLLRNVRGTISDGEEHHFVIRFSGFARSSFW